MHPAKVADLAHDGAAQHDGHDLRQLHGRWRRRRRWRRVGSPRSALHRRPKQLFPVVQFAVSPSSYRHSSACRTGSGASQGVQVAVRHGAWLLHVEMASKNPHRTASSTTPWLPIARPTLSSLCGGPGPCVRRAEFAGRCWWRPGQRAWRSSRGVPHIKCSVLDLPHVISQAPAAAARCSSSPATCLSPFHLQMLSYSRYHSDSIINIAEIKYHDSEILGK